MNSLQMSVVAIAALAILTTSPPSLSQIVSADKDCSFGKSLNEYFPSPKRGNQVGEDASYGAHNSPGPGVSETSRAINEGCHSNR